MANGRAQDAEAAWPGGKLERLLEVEERLEAMLRATRREAARLVEQAEAEAAERRRAVEERLEAEAEALRRRIEAEAEREVAAIREDAARRAARWRDADEETIDALAAFVVRRVAGREDDP